MAGPSTLTRLADAVATLGPLGRWPWGPGTLVSALLAALWLVPIPWSAWAAALVVVALGGAEASDRAERTLGHDDGRIVIDEAAGMMLALLAVPHTPTGIVAAFAAFRFFDIVKPPPIRRLQAVPGGWGVMLDDLAAGAIAAVVAGLAYELAG